MVKPRVRRVLRRTEANQIGNANTNRIYKTAAMTSRAESLFPFFVTVEGLNSDSQSQRVFLEGQQAHFKTLLHCPMRGPLLRPTALRALIATCPTVLSA